MILPRYPIYVPSKGRWKPELALTTAFLARERVPFHVVVEPQEHDAYAARVGDERVLVLPFANLGQGSIPARNWIMEHAIERGAQRHWQLDDNISDIYRLYRGKRIRCDSGPAFAAIEDFTDRYENIAIAGMNYRMFGMSVTTPFYLNVHVYSCALIDNSIEHRWRGRYNEDTDLCLQVLAAGYCTVLFNAFLAHKIGTMNMRGGNTDELYRDDGRLRMARSLERQWPGVVTTDRRFRRPQHVVRDQWRKFDTPLKLRDDVTLDDTPNEYGLTLQAVKDVRSATLRRFLDAERQERSK